jgi:type IV pilus assembly protein PilE
MPVIHRPAAPQGWGRRGFTLIELLAVIAVIALLATLAAPSMVDFVRRGRIIEAASRLSDHRVRMEQYFLDNRRYDDGAGGCGWTAPPPSPADTFSIACTAEPLAYTVTATGISGKGMQGFVYSIDHANNRKTVGVPSGWSSNGACWVMRRDGSCV